MKNTSIPEILFDALCKAGYPRECIGLARLEKPPPTSFAIVIAQLKSISDEDQSGLDTTRAILVISALSVHWNEAAFRCNEAYLTVAKYLERNSRRINKNSVVQEITLSEETSFEENNLNDGTGRILFEATRLISVYHY
jgi:hypothetical protein